MNVLGQSAFLKALGWALLNSMWQFGLIWMIFIIFTSTRKKLSPLFKHGLALLFMTVGFIWFAIGLSRKYFSNTNAESVEDIGYLMDSGVYSTFYLAADKFLQSNIPYFSFIYLLAVTVLSVRFLRCFNYSYTIQSKGLSKLNVGLRLYVQQVAEQLGIRRKVQVWVSEYIDTPMVMGFLKPTILIPLACINNLSLRQMEAVLLHELAHIKRNDYLVNLYIATVEILFFFNPFARLLIQSVKQERENSCDDWVLQFRFDRHQYASALLSLEKSRLTHYSLSVAATGGNNRILLKRIQRIMDVQCSDTRNGLKFFGYVFAIFLLGSIAFVHPYKGGIEKLTRDSFSILFANTSVRDNLSINQYTNKIRSENNPQKKEIVKADTKMFALEPDRIAILPEMAYPTFFAQTAIDDENIDVTNLAPALNVEVREFSIPEKKAPELPIDALVEQFPFVPASSFSHFYVEDTAKPKIKVDNYKQRTARESLAKAQKALECLDWKKIEKLVKNNADVSKLCKEIQRSLEDLNWQKIDEEVSETINKEAVAKMKVTLKAEYDHVQQYKNQVLEYQKIQDDLKRQQEKYQTDAETKLLDIQKQYQKKKVIVII